MADPNLDNEAVTVLSFGRAHEDALEAACVVAVGGRLHRGERADIRAELLNVGQMILDADTDAKRDYIVQRLVALARAFGGEGKRPRESMTPDALALAESVACR